MSACGWLLTVQTPLKVSFWTGTASAQCPPLCTHSPISFTFRFRALPEPQSAVTVWLFSCRSLCTGQEECGQVSTLSGSQCPKWRDFSGIPKRGSRSPWTPAARSTLPCSSTQVRASSRMAQAVKCGISANIPKRRSILPALLAGPAENAFLLTLAYSRPPGQAKMVDSLQGTQTLL